MEDNEDDIYLAPELLDSSSAASKSILSFTSWLTSSHSPVPDFDFILITDDRAFVALDSIANRLHKSVHASDRGKRLQKLTKNLIGITSVANFGQFYENN